MDGPVNNNFLKFSHTISDDGVFEHTDIMGELTTRFINVRAAATEKAVRDKLIELGWTPPAENNDNKE